MGTCVRCYTGNNSLMKKLHTIVSFLARRPGLCLLTISLVVFIGYVSVTLFGGNIALDEEQVEVNYIANNLLVNVQMVDNLAQIGTLRIVFTNGGYQPIQPGIWRIYFNSFGTFTTKTTGGFSVYWVNAGLYYLVPIEGEFQEIPPGKSITLILEGWKTICRTDFLPNWYVWSPKGRTIPAIIAVTADDTLPFVDAFNESSKWKRSVDDLYNPYTPDQRFKMHLLPKQTVFSEQLNVIPTPKTVKLSSTGKLVIDRSWVVVKFTDTDNESRSNVLAKRLGFREANEAPPSGNYFEFLTNLKFDEDEYSIEFKSQSKTVKMSSRGLKGAFYATQTLFMIIGHSGSSVSNSFPEIFIQDKPRFAYRGLMLDVARNFHSKETILKLLELMSTYKMNKLHFHLSDDEGWRLEIPGIPELTKYGSKRCHDFDKCLYPSLGSGPFTTTSGSGYYSVSDFREILRYAARRHIQIIPEFDMPGHAYTAVSSMSRRERNRQNSELLVKSESYLLSDDESSVRSVQGWTGNAINPCLNTTYLFVDRLLSALKTIYYKTQPLDIVHFGGDEVARGVWAESDSCRRLFQSQEPDHVTIKRMFMLTIGDIAEKHGLNIALWEDGAFGSRQPFDIKEFKPKEVYINTWNNMWNFGGGGLPIAFSDAGYKVILSMATHLYLDHPYEPDPEERGLYWATRFIDTYKIFGLMPMDIFANADFDRNGNRVDLSKICPSGKCPQIMKPDNVVGMEACVWSEVIRNEDHLFSMLFPRALAVAERAWHKGEWEDIQDPVIREKAKKEDWANFVQLLGESHLPELDRIGIKYRVPPPGIYVNPVKNTIEFNTLYPNHKIYVSLGNGIWYRVKSEIPIPKGYTVIRAKTLSPVLERESRIVALPVNVTNGNAPLLSSKLLIYCLFYFLTIVGLGK